MTPNYYSNVILRCFAHGSVCTFGHPPLRDREVLPATVLAVVLAMTLVVAGWGVAAPHAGDPWQITAPNPELYLPAGNTWQILDLDASVLLPQYAFAQTPSEAHFVTTWSTDSANQNVTIPVRSDLTYNYTVLWGDGTNSTGLTGNATHTYATADDHQIRIYGTYPGIHLDDHSDASKLISIDQWGSNEWASMGSAFEGTSNMVYKATDVPDLSGVSDMSYMFDGASTFNGNISDWNVLAVTDMSLHVSVVPRLQPDAQRLERLKGD